METFAKSYLLAIVALAFSTAAIQHAPAAPWVNTGLTVARTNNPQRYYQVHSP
jgi:hypothetical protein